jgi:hypothetical protein
MDHKLKRREFSSFFCGIARAVCRLRSQPTALPTEEEAPAAEQTKPPW